MRNAVVLAAGAGTKFWPYNVVRQKAAFPIANTPAVRRIVDSLVKIGVERIVVVVGSGEPSVRAALRGCGGDGKFVRQPGLSGTADAVLCGVEGMDGDFLAVYGDVVTDTANLRDLVRRFEEERPFAAALVQKLGDERPQDWLVAHTNGEQFVGVEGHGRSGSHRLCGAYALRADAVDLVRDHPGIMHSVPVGGMPPVEGELAQSLQTAIDERQAVLAVEANGYCVDLDKPWHILEANQRVLEAMSRELERDVIPASARIHDGAEIEGRLVLGEGCTIGNRVVVKGDLWMGAGSSLSNGAILEGPAVVGNSTKVRDYCLVGGHTSLGANGVYGHGAEFSGVALDKVYCYHYCEIWGVAGEAVDFGAATVCGNLRFDDSDTVWRIKGRPEAPGHAANAAYFGDFCRTGVNAILMPGRRVGAYSCLGAGVVAYDDVPDRQLVTVKQELATRPWGPEQYGW